MTRNQPRRAATTQRPLQVHEALNWIIHRVDRIEDKINRLLEAAAKDAVLDVVIGESIMALEDDILAKLETANTKQDGFVVLLEALVANQNSPAKLQAIAKAIDEQQADWEAAFAKTSQPEPPPPPIDPSAM